MGLFEPVILEYTRVKISSLLKIWLGQADVRIFILIIVNAWYFTTLFIQFSGFGYYLKNHRFMTCFFINTDWFELPFFKHFWKMKKKRNRPIEWANVVFKEDKFEKNVSIESIKYKKTHDSHITPTDENDFEKEHTYYVGWFSCGIKGEPCSGNESDHEHVYCYKKAQIFHLSGKL